MTQFKTALLIPSFIMLQFFANRAAALPTVIEAGSYTDRYSPTLQNTVIPAGDNLQIYAVVETADAPDSPTIAVSARQGDKVLTLNHFASLSAPDNFYWGFTDYDPSLTGAWEIIPTDSTGTGPSAFTDPLAEPELLPFVESITPQGSPRGASVEWTLPDLTGFDVESVHVRIVQVEPRSEVFSSDLLPVQTTSFTSPSGIFDYGVEYVYGISLIDDEGSYGENRSGVQSQPFRFVLPGDFNVDGLLTASDIDLLSAAVRTGGGSPDFDLSNDGAVNEADRVVWVDQVKRTYFGDADLDGMFDSGDLVSVLATGTYESDVESMWSSGDFNGDGRTGTGDLVVALADGGYEAGPRAAVRAVPEPFGLTHLGGFGWFAWCSCRRVRAMHRRFDIRKSTAPFWRAPGA